VKYGKAVSLVTNRPEEWTYLPPLVIWFFSRTDVREYVPHSGQEYGHVVALQTYVLQNWCAYGPTVACGGPVQRVRMKGKRLLWNDHWMFQACELDLPYKVLKYDSESSVSRGINWMDAKPYLVCLV
jgi:hypothetical protein